MKFRPDVSETCFYMVNTEVEEKVQHMEEQATELLSWEKDGP